MEKMLRQKIDAMMLNRGSIVMWTAGKSEKDDAQNRIARDNLARKMSDADRFDNRTITFNPAPGKQVVADISQGRRSMTNFIVFNEKGNSQMSPEEWVKERRKNDVSA